VVATDTLAAPVVRTAMEEVATVARAVGGEIPVSIDRPLRTLYTCVKLLDARRG